MAFNRRTLVQWSGRIFQCIIRKHRASFVQKNSENATVHLFDLKVHPPTPIQAQMGSSSPTGQEQCRLLLEDPKKKILHWSFPIYYFPLMYPLYVLLFEGIAILVYCGKNFLNNEICAVLCIRPSILKQMGHPLCIQYARPSPIT